MWWSRSRDILVETFTIVQRVDKNFNEHEKKQDRQVSDLYKLIKDCHESCPETQNFLTHTQIQNGTLLRMEKKYDTFFREHNVKIGKVEKKHDRLILEANLDLAKVKESITDIKTVKKCRKEIITDWIKYIAITCAILGVCFAFLRYQDSQKKVQELKIEKMLEEILKNS